MPLRFPTVFAAILIASASGAHQQGTEPPSCDMATPTERMSLAHLVAANGRLTHGICSHDEADRTQVSRRRAAIPIGAIAWQHRRFQSIHRLWI